MLTEHPLEKQILVRDIERVCIVRGGGKTELQTCYYDGPSITRFQKHTELTLYEARSGRVLKRGKVKGNLPRKCGRRERYTRTVLIGDAPDFHEVLAWPLSKGRRRR